MNFACVSLPYPGHINPMAALAKELVRRGHRATFFHYADAEPWVARWTLPFVALGARSHPSESMARAMADAGRVRGLFGYGPLIARLAGATAMLCDELPRALEAHAIDMILSDQLEAAGGLVAYHTSVPHVSIAAALPINWERGIPAPFVGWGYGETAWHLRRNSASAYGTRVRLEPVSRVIESFADRWRLVQGRQIENYMSGLAQISQLVPSLDFPRQRLSECFHYCGPLREAGAATTTTAPGRTMRAFSSLGTLQGHRMRLFEQIARAAADNGLHLTIAHGSGLSSEQAALLSRTAEVHAFVAQDEVLAESGVAIVHGGLNTVLDALSFGVPIVLVPLAFEQGAIAARVQRSGAGRICRSRLFRAHALTRAIADVRDDPSYAHAAATLQKEIQAAGGVTKAADIVEHVLASRRPYLNVGVADARP